MLNKNLTLLSVVVLSACGGGDSGDGVSGGATLNGAFINSPTKGIMFVSSPSGLSGTTDADGTFSYKAGDTVTFSLVLGESSITLGSTSSPSASTSVLSLSVPQGGDPLAVAQILETLDKSTADGKMDVSGIALSSGAVLTAITNALKSSSVSAADIGTIAAGVQNVLTATGAGSLKYGTTGVTLNDALTNLSKNPANQTLVETKIQNLNYDGSSTVLDVQDKPAFTNWIIKNGSSVSFSSRFGVISSTGLVYDYKYPYDDVQDGVSGGTYVLSNSNRNGSFTTNDGNTGSFSLKSGDSKSYSMTYINSITGETGAITGTYLLPLTINDVKSKTYVIYGGCSNGSDSTLTINSSGVSTDSCNSNVNGATWTAGPFTNTLQYTQVNGTRHYLGLTRLSKNGGNGNLPSGSVGTLMNISRFNYSSHPSAVGFKVN